MPTNKYTTFPKQFFHTQVSALVKIQRTLNFDLILKYDIKFIENKYNSFTKVLLRHLW